MYHFIPGIKWQCTSELTKDCWIYMVIDKLTGAPHFFKTVQSSQELNITLILIGLLNWTLNFICLLYLNTDAQETDFLTLFMYNTKHLWYDGWNNTHTSYFQRISDLDISIQLTGSTNHNKYSISAGNNVCEHLCPK